MGGWDRKKRAKTPARARKVAPSLATVSKRKYGLSTEFAADDPVRMPTPDDGAMLAAARIRREMRARTGRQSTRGTSVYGNTFLGSTN